MDRKLEENLKKSKIYWELYSIDFQCLFLNCIQNARMGNTERGQNL